MLAQRLITIATGLQAWRGDLAWVHREEGHSGKGAYWPGGASGVTLDPGVDLGYADRTLVESAYANRLSAVQMKAVRAALGIRGAAALARLRAEPVLRTIRISRAATDDIFAHVAVPYWRAITRRFPAILRASTPDVVHTVMLSLAFNRGPFNTDLAQLGDNLASGDWAGLAREIGAMQQRHPLAGIRERRRREGRLVESGIPATEAQHDEQLAEVATGGDERLYIAAQVVSRYIAGLTPLPLRPLIA